MGLSWRRWAGSQMWAKRSSGQRRDRLLIQRVVGLVEDTGGDRARDHQWNQIHK